MAHDYLTCEGCGRQALGTVATVTIIEAFDGSQTITLNKSRKPTTTPAGRPMYACVCGDQWAGPMPNEGN